jgi:hypothetical protein
MEEIYAQSDMLGRSLAPEANGLESNGTIRVGGNTLVKLVESNISNVRLLLFRCYDVV